MKYTYTESLLDMYIYTLIGMKTDTATHMYITSF